MSKYLGEITVKNDFVNFKPYYIYSGDTFSLLTRIDRQALLPESELENINFYSSNPNYVVRDSFYPHEYCILDFETEDLEANVNTYTGERNRTGYRVDVSNLEKNRLRSLHEIGFYHLIEVGSIVGNYRTNAILSITDPNAYEGMMVVLELPDSGDTLLGPFSIALREKDDQLIVKTNSKSDKHMIPAIKFLDGFGADIRTFGLYENEQKYVKINKANCEETWIDVIPKEVLLKNFKDTLSSDVFENGRLNLTNIEGAVEAYAASYLVGDDIPSEIKSKRLDDLRTMMTDEEHLNDTFGFIGDTIAALLLKYKDKESFALILQSMADDPQFMGQVQRFEIINSRIAEKDAELNNLTQELDAVRKQKETENNSSAAEVIIGEKKAEIDAIQDELISLQNQLKFTSEGVTLQAYLKQLNEDVDYKEKRERELDTLIKGIEGKLDGIFTNSAEKALNFAFDGMLSSRMLQTAAAWDAEQRHQDYAGMITSLKGFAQEGIEKAELIDYLCEQVSKYRPTYGKNAILNIFICITQGFLTVFSGEPGTGKTSICNIIGNTLGLTLPKEKMSHREDDLNPNRYISVSVERGWTSKRDFIGYYNPLTKQFDRSNSRLYDGLNFIDIEANGDATNLPYLVLLDEANLSPMEYYWADFMNICDDISKDSVINMGEDFHFQIPAFLRFVATLNNDHTTEALSPRLIDRAWVIKLPTVKYGTAKGTKLNLDDVKAISWSSLVDAFDVDMESAIQISGTAKEVYEAVLAQLKSAKITVSPRADVAIRRYWSVAQSVFENESEYAVDASIVALDYAISQRILPHINGSGEQFSEALKTLSKLCSEKNLRLSADALSEIIRKGDEMMFYYQYFA